MKWVAVGIVLGGGDALTKCANEIIKEKLVVFVSPEKRNRLLISGTHVNG